MSEETDAQRTRTEELQSLLRCATQIDPAAAWVVVKGRLDGKGDISGIFFGATFGASEAISQVLRIAADIADEREPDRVIDNRNGKEKLG